MSRYVCDECGGDMKLVEAVNSDAHATESYECRDCGATGEAQFGHGPDFPKHYGAVTE
jgi:DNA-directed RNA polymerase subunit RPC12/RpoP